MKLHLTSSAMLLLALASSLDRNARAEDEAVFSLPAEATENLKLVFSEVSEQAVGAGIRAPGVVRLDEKRVVEVVPRIGGIIAGDHQAIGGMVNKGDLLFQLESAELSQALLAYIDAEETMAFAGTALEQEKQLVAKDLSSREQLQLRELEFRQAHAEHARALQPLKLLHFDEATVHKYLSDSGGIDYTSLDVTAPRAGEIIEKSIRIGSAVEPDETLYTIADLSELWIDFQVSLGEVDRLQPGSKVTVSSSVNEQRGSAEIIYVAPVADEATRTVLVRAVLKNADGKWRSGTPVVVTSHGNGSAKVLAVSAGAVVDFDGGKAVFVRRDDNSFVTTAVEIGDSDGEIVEVVSGLEAGQMVVSENAAQLKGHLEMTAGD